MAFEMSSFVDKYLLALEHEQETNPAGGVTGVELEWNIYDANFQPVFYGGANGKRISFVDHMRECCLPAWLDDFNKLEVFHWMTEWITRPHYTAAHTIYEGWLLEGCLMNALAVAGATQKQRYYAGHGNLLAAVEVGHDAIPGSWNIAKRRYLERCVDLYGSQLATAGLHVNLSLPESMLSWDFMHLHPSQRDNLRFDDYKSGVYVEATRLMRAFAALSIAVTASTPMRPERRDGVPVVLLTDVDSNRNLTFPNDRNLDVPYLYRSYDEYVKLSYDLIKRGVRFGNNNWTPVRARSSADPVERIISITSDQLISLDAKGLLPSVVSKEEMARQIEQENLMARIDLPMSRVELRTDEGGHEIEVDIAHLTLVQLLLLRFYADPVFARAFRYDVEDIARARRNESKAATHGLRAEIEDPLTAKPIPMREFLGWTLEQVRPLAEALNLEDQLEPLVEMYRGGPNTSEKMRAQIREMIGDGDVVPKEVLIALAEERESKVREQVERIASDLEYGQETSEKLKGLVAEASSEAHRQPVSRLDFHAAPQQRVEITYADKTSEIVALSEHLIRIPSVTNCADERLDEVMHAAHFIRHYLEDAGVKVRRFEDGPYPAILAHFPDQLESPVMLSGHFDVVEPMPDDTQFMPRIEGDYLWGRGAADMKTVVATYLVWMKDQMKAGLKPAINLMLVGNEENGEIEPNGTPHVLAKLMQEIGYAPQLMIAGERTGEKGHELAGEVCVENRGVCRFRLIASGKAGHTGTAKANADLTQRLIIAARDLNQLMAERLTLTAADGWITSARYPFMNVGQAGVYNITATRGELGVEIRPIPQDDLGALISGVRSYAESAGLELVVEVQDEGIVCRPDNPHLLNVLAAVRDVSGEEARVGRKLPGTSARFAPQGQAIVWGQSGLGPHAADERHFIPSIEPYYRMLNVLGERYAVGVGDQVVAK